MARVGDTKLSPALQSRAAESPAPDALIDVVVELEPATGAADAGALRAAFDRSAAPVLEAIGEAGGEVLGQAWINQTVRARVPAERLEDVAGLAPVMAVDVPHRIEPD